MSTDQFHLYLTGRHSLKTGGGCIVLLAWAVVCLSCGAPGGQPVHRAPGPEREGPASQPSLLLVTIDTWRWDYIGASGSGRVKTPNLDRLAREGIYEPEAITPCPLTTPAHASLFTGQEPRRHGVWDCTRYALPEAVPNLAGAFRSAGYGTAAFVACEPLKKRYGLARGFDYYDDSGLARRGKGDWAVASRDGAEVTGAVLDHLRARRPGERLMVWAHYFDLHLPYRPRPAFDAQYPKDPYAAQAAFVDSEIGKLLAALRSDPGRTWRVVVVGDHGEGLGDKGEATHGIGLYRSTLHVPLVIHPKPVRTFIHAKPWGLIDLAPTIIEWFDLPEIRNSDGESLFGAGAKERALIAASIEPVLMFGVNPVVGVLQGKYKYLKGGSEELYDLAADPAEEIDLAAQGRVEGTLAELRGAFDRAWPRRWLRSALSPSLDPTPEEEKALLGLGYLSGGPSPASEFHRARIDQVLKDRSDWERAREEAFRTGRDTGLLDLYPRLVSAYPGSFALRKAFGALLAKAGRPREAVAQLEAAVRMNPEDGTTLTNLGTLYLSQGNMVPGRAFLEKALKLDPINPVAHKSLGILYADHLNEPGKAIFHYQKYLDAGGDAEAGRIRAYIERERGAGRPAPPPGK